jgi:1,4-dihydroxy-2-naphthoate octaprenyltransferase
MTTPAVSLPTRKLWMQLLLYPGHTLPTAAAPVLVGAGLAVRDGVFQPVPVALFLVGSWLLHVAGVFTDNHTLLARHADVPEHPELLQALDARTLALPTLRKAILLCLLLAALCGTALLAGAGPWVLGLGAVGLVASLGYHGGPWPYANRGLADPVFFAMFGVVAVAATYGLQVAWVQPGMAWSARDWPSAFDGAAPWLLGLPVGALVTCVLVIDDIRDRGWDARKGWRTPPVRWGLGFSRAEFAGLMVFAYAMPLALWAAGASVWTLLPLATVRLAWGAWLAVRQHSDTPALRPWTPRVAMLGLLYAALQALGLALSRWLA